MVDAIKIGDTTVTFEDRYEIECAKMQPADIVDGGLYVYRAALPAGCAGHLYRVLRKNVLDVPSYGHKVLVEALSGKDKGLWFTCSPANFCQRYVPAPVEQLAAAEPPAEKIAGAHQKGTEC